MPIGMDMVAYKCPLSPFQTHCKSMTQCNYKGSWLVLWLIIFQMFCHISVDEVFRKIEELLPNQKKNTNLISFDNKNNNQPCTQH
jgi:hypothetical protein